MDSNSLPILDFSQQDGLAESLLHACRNYGFFYLTNHGVSSELIEDVFEQSKAFFSLPLENKMECLVDKNGRGYTRMREEKLDPSMQTIGDTKEGYYIGRESDKNLPLHGANQWPSKVLLPRWREVMVRLWTLILLFRLSPSLFIYVTTSVTGAPLLVIIAN
tara:strand:- start:575 stop:1060 length:486 start_codon:yes stop_codon:yes gene_type:complete